VPSFAGKGQKIFVTALSATDPGKPVMEHAAIQISIDHFFDIRAKKAGSLFTSIFIDAFEGLEMVLHALVIWRILRSSRMVNGFGHGYPLDSRLRNLNSNIRADLICWAGVRIESLNDDRGIPIFGRRGQKLSVHGCPPEMVPAA